MIDIVLLVSDDRQCHRVKQPVHEGGHHRGCRFFVDFFIV